MEWKNKEEPSSASPKPPSPPNHINKKDQMYLDGSIVTVVSQTHTFILCCTLKLRKG